MSAVLYPLLIMGILSAIGIGVNFSHVVKRENIACSVLNATIWLVVFAIAVFGIIAYFTLFC